MRAIIYPLLWRLIAIMLLLLQKQMAQWKFQTKLNTEIRQFGILLYCRANKFAVMQ